MAVYNGIRWLPEQIRTILDQVGVAVTLFVSVDVSTDGSEEWVNRLAAVDSRIRVLPHGYYFGGAAQNFFRMLVEIDFTEFDYVSLADQDDFWFQNKLSRAHEILVNNEVAAYSSNVVALWPDGRKVFVKKSQPQVRWDFLFEAAGPGCTYVMKKELVCAIQDLLKKRWRDMQQVELHDWFLYAFARAKGYAWVIDTHALMLYRQHEKNQLGVNFGWHAFIFRMHKILSGWWLTQAALIARLVELDKGLFVPRWLGRSRIGMLWLALHAWQCRRRIRDKLIFALSCVALCIVGNSHRPASSEDSLARK